MPRRILVVDDNEPHRYALTRILRREGYEIDQSGDAEDAWRQLDGGLRAELVILDVVLPGMSGIDLCRKIKADPRLFATPVLHTSASLVAAGDRAYGIDSGADGYLVQPIDPAELLAHVRALLRIRDVEDRLRRSNHELELFAHAAAHDLKEPLRMITNYVQLFQRRYSGGLAEEASQWFAYVVDGTRRMSKLIDMLLAFAAVESAPPARVEVDASELVQGAIENLRLQLRESGGVIESGPMPCVRVDATQLVQVLQNLLANAIKFRSEAPPKVVVTADDRGDDWLFSVADNGIGIPAEHRERVFGLFQRIHAQRGPAGTGLGLALCRKIVEHHGGRIWVDANEGGGTTFRFTIPKAAEVGAPSAHAHARR